MSDLMDWPTACLMNANETRLDTDALCRQRVESSVKVIRIPSMLLGQFARQGPSLLRMDAQTITLRIVQRPVWLTGHDVVVCHKNSALRWTLASGKGPVF